MDIKRDNYHFFFDGYEIPIDKLNDTEIISKLLLDINTVFLNNEGEAVIIPCFGNKDLLDDGISGIILGDGFHFTCHTFSNKNTIFVDLFSTKKIDNESIIKILNKYFEVKKYDLCTNNKTTGKFGKHIILKTDIIEYKNALNLIDKIIDDINMHPIHEKIFLISKNGYDILRPIAESHVSIHCHKGDCILDVFSCNSFDEKKIIENLNNVYSIMSVERGIFF